MSRIIFSPNVDQNMYEQCTFEQCEYEHTQANDNINNKLKIKGNLKRHIEYWYEIGANNIVLDIINNGYRIPFTCLPFRANLNNNKSDREYNQFVKEAIQKLVKVCYG